MTDPLGQSQVIPYLAGLSSLGYEITILSCEKTEAFNSNHEPVADLLKQNNIDWVHLPYTKKPPVFSTLLDVARLRNAAKEIHKKKNINLVHTRPGIPALVGLWLKKKYGIKFLNDIREFYADSRVDGGMWKLKNPLYRTIYSYFIRKEKEAVATSDGIVCLTYAAEKIIQSWPQFVPGTPLQVIPCSVDLELFNPESLADEAKKTARNELGIREDNKVFCYLGSIGGWYLTDEMLRLCKFIYEKVPGAKFLFISPQLHEVILNSAIRFGLPAESIIVRKADRSGIPKLLSVADYSIFFIKPCYSKLSSSPTKHGELMAMGIPVITNSGVGDMKEIVKKYQGGIVIDNFEDDTLRSVAKELATDPPFDKAKIRQGALEFYSLSNAVAKYSSIYKAILQ